VVAWLVAIGSVVASWIVAAAYLTGELVRDWNQPRREVLGDCMTILREVALGRDGALIQIGLLMLATIAIAALAVLLWRLGRSMLRARAATHEHARMTRIAGAHRRCGGGGLRRSPTHRMCADVAARTHGPATVLGALLALSGAATIPISALGATGVGVLARATRLATPPRPAQRIRVRLMLAAVSALRAVGPLLMVLLTATGVALCGPMIE
jgi:hypothetical protein